MGLSVPTPGWLATRMMHAGTPVALALLGIAVTLADGKASDEELDEFFYNLSRTDDSVWVVNQHYVALEHAYPFLSGYLGAITGWTEQPGLEQYNQVRQIACDLNTVCWSKTEPAAGGDLMGRVANQMMSIGARRTRVFDYVPIGEAYAEMVMRGLWTRPHGSFIDAWCGSGTRVVALHRLLLDCGYSTDIPWRLNDPNPSAIAMAGLNMVAYDVGPDVKLSCNREWAEVWGTSTFWGTAPSIRRTLPPELSIDAPLPPARGRKIR